jgi:hypothetical protein
MHDFTPKAIKLFQVDPNDPARREQVLLSLAHIVRMVPRYYVESGGKQMVTVVDVDDGRTPERGLKRSFTVFDDLGGKFDSHTASEKAQAMLEQLWNESA